MLRDGQHVVRNRVEQYLDIPGGIIEIRQDIVPPDQVCRVEGALDVGKLDMHTRRQMLLPEVRPVCQFAVPAGVEAWHLQSMDTGRLC